MSMHSIASCLRDLWKSPHSGQQDPAGGQEPPGSGDEVLVTHEDIVLDAVFASVSELFAEIGQHFQSVHGLDGYEIARALAHREGIASTALGEGVALPHARVRGLDHVRTMYLRLRFPLPFGAADGLPVRHVFVILAPKQAAQRHLDFLSRVTRAIADPEFRRVIDGCVFAADAARAFETLSWRDAAMPRHFGKLHWRG